VAKRTITVNGVSKAYAMTGWRIGFLAAPAPVATAIIRFQGQTTGNPASPSQAAALAALTGPQEIVESMRTAYARRRDRVVASLSGARGIELVPPSGAFYAFPRVTEASAKLGGSVALAGALVKEGVGVVPGAGFGAEGHLRLSFAVADDALDRGLERFKQAISRIVQ
jgi:aspartate aminotransferase